MNIFILITIVFILIKVFQVIFKKTQEESERNKQEGQTLPQPKTTTIYDFSNSYMEDTIKSPIGFYSFHIDRERKEFSFTTEDTSHRFAYAELSEYAIRTQNEAVIIIDLKISRISLPTLQIECFSKIKAIGRLPEDMRRPVPLHQLYESELEKAEEVGKVLTEVMKEKTTSSKETPPPFKIKEKAEKVVDDIKEKVKEIPKPQEIIESVENRKEENIPAKTVEPFVHKEEQKRIEEPSVELFTEITNEPPSEKHMEDSDDASVKILLSDVEYYSYGKFLEADIREAVGNAKIKGQKDILITKEQLERLKQ